MQTYRKTVGLFVNGLIFQRRLIGVPEACEYGPQIGYCRFWEQLQTKL